MNAIPCPPDDISALAARLVRPPDAHKGSFGKALIIGGSSGMSGAAALAGMAALRGGAGLVHVAVPEASRAIVAAWNPCYLTSALPDFAAADVAAEVHSNPNAHGVNAARSTIQTLADSATAVAIGPGLGRGAEWDQLIPELYRTLPRPMVVDADAINALAETKRDDLSSDFPRILTPHPGEFARLTGLSTDEVQQNRTELARDFAARHKVILVLKGQGSIIADLNRLMVNETGNPGMATGGTGDVLTGLITALLCQGLEPHDAARLGVWLHGAAGDFASASLGEISVIATDLLDELPQALRLVKSG